MDIIHRSITAFPLACTSAINTCVGVHGILGREVCTYPSTVKILILQSSCGMDLVIKPWLCGCLGKKVIPTPDLSKKIQFLTWASVALIIIIIIVSHLQLQYTIVCNSILIAGLLDVVKVDHHLYKWHQQQLSVTYSSSY